MALDADAAPQHRIGDDDVDHANGAPQPPADANSTRHLEAKRLPDLGDALLHLAARGCVSWHSLAPAR